jgi:hypothetical protein
MTAAERIHQLVDSLPAEQVNEILDFAEFLYQKQANPRFPLTNQDQVAVVSQGLHDSFEAAAVLAEALAEEKMSAHGR